MARRKNYKRRRTILSNTFHLIRENGLDNVSFQMIAEKSGISKSLLQSYYPHKSSLITDVVRNILNTLDKQVQKFGVNKEDEVCARTKAFIYAIEMLGIYDEGLKRIITEVFKSNESLDFWSKTINDWLKEKQLFDHVDFDAKEVRLGIAFVVTGISRLYYDNKEYDVSPEEIADYGTKSFMYSFLHCSKSTIDKALKEGHEIIESTDVKTIHHAIDTMFDEDKEIVC